MTTQEPARKRMLNVTLDRLDIIVMVELLGLFLVGVLISGNAHLLSQQVNGWAWLDSVFQNAGTEMLGAALTFYLIEVIVRKRREQDADRRAIDQEKRRLILQMGSDNSAFAKEAARILRLESWGLDDDTTLQGANLMRANLPGEELDRVNLQGSNLYAANLEEAKLGGANLCGVELGRANLQGANLIGANLQGAILRIADLRRAHLVRANLYRANLIAIHLEGAILQGANLQEASLWDSSEMLEDAIFDETTILPDGSNWTSDTDMRRFTDPEHPDFWRSDIPESPFYRGKADQGDVS